MRGGWIALLVLGGCTSVELPPQAPLPVHAPPAASATHRLPHYRCDNDLAFTVRFDEDSAIIDAGARGTQMLARDAGGLTPSQTVYSSTSMRAQFGLGADGREAQLNYASPPLVAHCTRD